jgi:hypothetical protein
VRREISRGAVRKNPRAPCLIASPLAAQVAITNLVPRAATGCRMAGVELARQGSVYAHWGIDLRPSRQRQGSALARRFHPGSATRRGPELRDLAAGVSNPWKNVMPSFQRLLPLFLLSVAGPAGAQQLVWLQNSDGYSIVESSKWSSPSAQDVEAADDFTFNGAVTRVIVHGYKDFHATGSLPIDGAWVRFYASQGGAPGPLQQEFFLPEGAPNFVHTPYPTKLDLTLPVPFQAAGAHFVSVQLVTPASHDWRWWSSHTQSPVGAPAHVKNDLAGGGWSVYSTGLGYEGDLAFELWGDDGTPFEDPVDPCGAWEELNVPALPDNYGTTVLRDLVAIANDDVWAVGDPSVDVLYLTSEYKNLALHWDGSDWTVVPTPNPGVMPDPYQATGLQAIDAAGPDAVWAVGNWERQQDVMGWIIDQPLVLRWTGSGWDHLIVPNTNFDTYTYDVKVFAADDAWLIGGGANPLAIHWDGSGFELVDTPDFGAGGTPGFDFVAADGAASDDLWAVGGGSDGDFSGKTVIAHWDGSSFTPVSGPTPGFARRLFDVHARATDDVWAVGQYEELVGSSVQYFGWAIHWDGSSWTLFDGAVEAVGSLAVHAFAPDDVYTGGGGIYHYDGTAWSVADDLGQLPGDNISVSVTSLDAVEPCHLVAAGRQDVAGELVPFTARQQGPHVWATHTDSCEASPGIPDGILLLSGPKLGHPFTVAIGDPNGAAGVTAGATATFWAISRSALPCGLEIPGAGVGGAPAALLANTSPGALLAIVGPALWGGIASPGIHTVLVPSEASLIGLELVTQGALFDPSQPAPLRLSDALEAKLGL